MPPSPKKQPLVPIGCVFGRPFFNLCRAFTKNWPVNIRQQHFEPMRIKAISVANWLVAVSLFTLNLSQNAWAQSNKLASASTPAPSAGLMNDWLREQSPVFDAWNIGGQFRSRFEHKESFAVPSAGQVDFSKRGDADNTFGLFRERFHAGYTPCLWFSVFGEFQDSSAVSDDRNPSPDNDHYQLRQAWVLLGDAKKFPFTAKLGRQELNYGDQRLVGMADWLNIGRTFDAAKVRYENSDFWVDGFISRPVIPDKTRFDESDDHDRLSGMYASSKTLLPFQETQIYFLSRNVEGRPASEAATKLYPLSSPRDIYTIGLRFKSLSGALKGWDYELEADGQFGRFKKTATSPNLSQRAFAIHVAGGYTWTNAVWSPRLGLEYNYASGDGSSADRSHGTFDNLFPSNHGLYGAMDFFSLQNMQDVHLGFSVKPTRKLIVKLDGYAFWLADTHDFLYAGNGTPRSTGGYGIHPGAGNYVGSELDLIGTYTVTSFVSASAGYGHLFAGEYLRHSLASAGGARDGNYLFAQLMFNF
jgi:hypothetical protein